MISPGYLDNPADLIPSRDLPQEETDFVLWLRKDKDDNDIWVTLEYWYKEQFGVRTVSVILPEVEMSRDECEEALKNYLGEKVEFEQSMTIKYKN